MMKWLEKHPRQDTILITVNIAAALFNVGWALAFPENWFAWLNWFAGGFCACGAATQPTLNKLRQLVDDQHASLVASNAAMNAVSPEHMRTMLHGALSEVVEQMKREGKLPADAEIELLRGNLPKSLH